MNTTQNVGSSVRQSETFRFDIFMAGDIAQAKQVCREYCFAVGFCVTVEPVDFIYTGGEEAGFRIGIINYPRFPAQEAMLQVRARQLAKLLMKRLCQDSFSIVGPRETEWFARDRKVNPKSTMDTDVTK